VGIGCCHEARKSAFPTSVLGSRVGKHGVFEYVVVVVCVCVCWRVVPLLTVWISIIVSVCGCVGVSICVLFGLWVRLCVSCHFFACV